MEVVLTGLTLPLRLRPSVPMTDEDLMVFSSSNECLPIEREANGDILVMSPSGSGSSSKNVEISFELELWNRRVGGGVVFESNGGFTLPDGSVRAADAAWLSLAKWEALSPRDQQRYAPVCPEFVIELRSPSDSLAEQQVKMDMWLQNGVQLGWLIDPQERAVTIYTPDRGPERLYAVSLVAGTGPVAGFVLPLDRIFTC